MAHSPHSLSIINDASLRADKSELALLQKAAIEQHHRITRSDAENALRCLFLGCALHRIKASLKHGDFGPWIENHFPRASRRQVTYYMKAALVFIDRAKVQKPELLALPGDQLDLAVDGPDSTARRFAAKAMKFIGELSFAELLVKYGIKETKKIGGAREKGVEDETTGKPATPEQLYQQSRDEIGGTFLALENLIKKENRLVHLKGHAEELRGIAESSAKLNDAIQQAVAVLLKP